MKKFFQDFVFFKISGIASGWLLTMAVSLQQDPMVCALQMAAFALLGALAGTFPDPKLRWLPRLTPLLLLLPFRPIVLLCTAAAFSGGMIRVSGGRQILYFSGAATGTLLAFCAGGLLYRPMATALAIAALMPALFALTIYKLPLTRIGKILFPLLFFLAAAVNLVVFLVWENHLQRTLTGTGSYGAWQIRKMGNGDKFHYSNGNFVCKMPDDMMRRKSTLLPAALQCTDSHSKVLFIAAAPSATAKCFLEFPWVDQIFLLLEGFPAQLLSKDVRDSFYLGFAELDKIPRDIQLIYLSELPPMSSRARLGLLQKLRDFAPDAPIVLPDFLAEDLPDHHPLPGAPGMTVWGGKSPALTFAALEERLAHYDPAQAILPAGMLEVLYSLSDPQPAPPPAPSSLVQRWDKYLLQTMPQLRHGILPAILTAALLLLRFLLERYPSAGAQGVCTLNAAAWMASLLLLAEGVSDQPALLWGRSPMLLLAMAFWLPPGAPGRGRSAFLLIPAIASVYAGLFFGEPLGIAGGIVLIFAASFCPLQETKFRMQYLHAFGLLCGVLLFRFLPPGAEGMIYALVLLLPNLRHYKDSSSSLKR